MLRALVKDPRFAATVNDIVVEFGEVEVAGGLGIMETHDRHGRSRHRARRSDFSEFENPDERYRVRGDDDFVPIPRDRWMKRPLEDIVDAVL